MKKTNPRSSLIFLAEQASLRSESWILDDLLAIKNAEIRDLTDDINKFRFRFNLKLRKVAEALGVGYMVEDL